MLNLFEKENNDLKTKLKRSEDLRLQCLEENIKLEFDLADVVDDHQIKMDAMRLNIRKIRKYAINQESSYHYAVGSIIILVAILIAFVVGFKFYRQLYVSFN